MKPKDSLLDLIGETAIVTGGAKGIGYAIAYRLAEAGAHVLIADTDEQSSQQAVKRLGDKNWTAIATKADVSNEAEVKAMMRFCRKNLGPVTILVNNAGVYPPIPISQMTQDQFERVMDVNLRSTFLMTKYAAEIMRQNGGGKIINITSIDALHPSMVGLAHYDASKHGMWGFTKNSALELAKDKIWVNAIAPGGIATPGVTAMNQGASPEQMAASTEAFMAKIPMHRMGEADEIGKAALFLASDMASYMTGEQVVVDGGVLLG